MMPSPMRRLAFTVASISGSGYGFISMTSSRKRTARRTTRSISSQSMLHSPLSARRPNRDTLSDPRLQASLGRSGCSPHGFVASIIPISGVGLAGLSLMRSMKTMPGSPVRQAARTMRSNTSRARQPLGRLAGMRVDEVVLLALLERVHERVGGGHGDVEVRDPTVELALDELQHVGMVDLQDPHVGAAPRAALLHRLRRAVEDAQERHRPGGPAAGRLDEVVLGTQPREREPGPAAALVDDGGGLHRVEDLLHRVADRQDVAGRVLQAVALAGVHQRRRVRQEAVVDHDLVEGFGDLPHRRRAPAVPRLARGDGQGDAPAHLLGSLDHLPVLAREIALTQDAQRWLSPLAHLRRTDLRQHALPPPLTGARLRPYAVCDAPCRRGERLPGRSAQCTPAPPISCGVRDDSTQNVASVKEKGVHALSTGYPPGGPRAVAPPAADPRDILWLANDRREGVVESKETR